MSQEKVAEVIDLNASRQAQEAEKETAGDFLRAARSAASLDIAGVSEEIKVKPEHLEAIEANDPSRLPATPYAVGFVKVYAQFLDLDVEAVVRQFKTDIGAGEGAIGPAVNETEESDARPEFGESARLASIFGVVAIVIFMIWAMIQVAGTAERSAGAPPTPERRVVVVDEAASAPQPRAALDGVADASPAVVVIEGALPVEPEPTSEVATTNETAVDEDIASETSANVETPEAASAQPEEVAAAQSEAAEEALEGTARVPEEIEQIETAAITETPEAVAADESAPGAIAEEEVAVADAAPIIADDPLAAETEDPPAAAPRQSTPPPAPVVVAAKLKRSIAPRYPEACDRGAAAIEKVDVIFDITAQGRPANARIASTSNDCFNSAALDALKRWRFDPKTVDGAPRPDLAKRATLNFRK